MSYKKNTRHILLLLVIMLGIWASPALCQNKQEIIQEALSIYAGNSANKTSGLIGGYSAWGLIYTLIFSGIGFVAFIYGKKNAEFRPMLIGIGLMIYPYFIHSTFWLFCAGLVLCLILYYWRE